MSGRPSRRHMLIPEGAFRPFVPVLPEAELAFAIGKLAPPERKALAQIVETADVPLVENRSWLLVPADARLLDTLAAFGAEAEDRELCMEDEVETDDDTSDHAKSMAAQRFCRPRRRTRHPRGPM